MEKRFIVPINGLRWGDDIEWVAPEGITTFGEKGAELDVRGSDVGLENPYTMGDGGTGYPSTGGDPTNYSRCAWEGMPISCGQAFKIASWQHVIDRPRDPGRPAPGGISPTHEVPPHTNGTSVGNDSSTDRPAGNPDQGSAVPPASAPCDDTENPKEGQTVVVCTNVNLGNPNPSPTPPVKDLDANVVQMGDAKDGRINATMLLPIIRENNRSGQDDAIILCQAYTESTQSR